MSKLVAIVEDEAALAANYQDALKQQGYRVSHYYDRASAVTAFGQRLPDLVIIDIGLGDEPEGGFELCKFLRRRSARLPIIFLSARDSDADKISGLRLEADDYLTKDISLVHLMARVNALFRRIAARGTDTDESGTIRQGPLLVNTDCATATWRDEKIDLTVTECWVVAALARHPGHLKSREQLMQAGKLVVEENTITSMIKRIRRKISEVDAQADPIQTEYGMGYRWRPDTE